LDCRIVFVQCLRPLLVRTRKKWHSLNLEGRRFDISEHLGVTTKLNPFSGVNIAVQESVDDWVEDYFCLV
jgi:hypothetical protein